MKRGRKHVTMFERVEAIGEWVAKKKPSVKKLQERLICEFINHDQGKYRLRRKNG